MDFSSSARISPSPASTRSKRTPSRTSNEAALRSSSCPFWAQRRPTQMSRLQLVALHRGFDELIVAGTQGWQRFGIDQHLDAPGYSGSASDPRVAFERQHHLVN